MGFPLDLFDRDLDEAFICWICEKVLHDPLATPCGHVFCASCANAKLKESNSCPKGCPTSLSAKELNRVLPLSKLIGKLNARCSNWCKGCPFVGPLHCSEEHMLGCEYHPKICPECGEETEDCTCSLEDNKEIKEENLSKEELRKRTQILEEQLFVLRKKLKKMETLFPTLEYSTSNDGNYEVEVNGQDLSGASHKEAAHAFKNAPEPITVVLRRNNTKNNDDDVIAPRNSFKAPSYTPSVSCAATQTSQVQENLCFCQTLIQNCQNAQTNLSALIMSELMRYKNAHSGLYDVTGHTADTLGRSFMLEDEDEVFGFEYEEVVLKRSSNQEKLGIMLQDQRDPYTDRIRVTVSEVAPFSIAEKSQNIQTGDQIVKINGTPVTSMAEASTLLHKDIPSITFMIRRQHPYDDEQWNEDFEGDDVLRDVTNYDDVMSATSDESRPRFLEQRTRDGGIEYAAIVSQKLATTARTTDSGTSHSSVDSSPNEKDSGIGRTTDGSSVQSVTDNATSTNTQDSRRFGTDSSRGSSAPHSVAKEFTFVASKDYHYPKRSFDKPVDCHSTDSAKGSMERSVTEEKSNQFQRLSDAIQHLELEDAPKSPNCIPDDVDDDVSPWVKIARQDYEDKIRQIENKDSRNYHPAGISSTANMEDVIVAIAAERNSNSATDNTSSAYSTGESFRSTSTASAPRISIDSLSPPLSPKKSIAKPHTGPTISYISSDANSDGEGPACYLTHAEDSESEGFEDAGVEFSSIFTSATPPKLPPTPLPRLLHPPQGPNFHTSASLTASTKELWKAAAAVAKNRRHTQTPETIEQNSMSRSRNRSDSRSVGDASSSKDRSESETVVASQSRNSAGDSTCTDLPTTNHLASKRHRDPNSFSKSAGSNDFPSRSKNYKFRRSSDNMNPSVSCNRPDMATRSQSYTEGSAPSLDNIDGATNTVGEGSSNGDVRMEWKVRVSRDGTRYITKRPVREKVLRDREQKLLVERCGVTTDDDAITELKLGRHWSREERKRHLRHAREKKRRRDFMQRCRLEVLTENVPADTDIVELSHKKMERRKHKRMLLDSFVTVQEILAHGDKTTGTAALNPLLSVTYI
ncbi:E3 ubiquitin-protein ligase PDZRN3-like isoform X1 [Ciona intestinalis]